MQKNGNTERPERLDILPKREREALQNARRKGKETGRVVEVRGYSRSYYRLTNRDARIARRADAEQYVWRLVAHRWRCGRVQGDIEIARELIAALEDAFFPQERRSEGSEA
jgi:hypothetical protein